MSGLSSSLYLLLSNVLDPESLKKVIKFNALRVYLFGLVGCQTYQNPNNCPFLMA